MLCVVKNTKAVNFTCVANKQTNKQLDVYFVFSYGRKTTEWFWHRKLQDCCTDRRRNCHTQFHGSPCWKGGCGRLVSFTKIRSYLRVLLLINLYFLCYMRYNKQGSSLSTTMNVWRLIQWSLTETAHCEKKFFQLFYRQKTPFPPDSTKSCDACEFNIIFTFS